MTKFKDYLYYMDKKLLLEKGNSYKIGRISSSDVCLPDDTVSKDHAVIFWDGDDLVLEDLNSTNSTMINYHKIEKQKLKDFDKITIGPFNLIFRTFEDSDNMGVKEYDSILTDTLIIENKIAKILDEIKDKDEMAIKDRIFDLKHALNKSKEKLNIIANVDSLTKLFNRKYFEENIQREIERAKRYKSEMCLLLIDIDHFKKFNDTYGHQKGDEVLAATSSMIMNNIRSTDFAARYGGEEIAVVLPETIRERAGMVAEKIRSLIEKESKDILQVEVTVSIGVASIMEADFELDKIIGNADKVLYEAKENGRNRVEVFR